MLKTHADTNMPILSPPAIILPGPAAPTGRNDDFKNSNESADLRSRMKGQSAASLLPAGLEFLLIISSLPVYGAEFSGRVVAITDGDTIKVMHDGRAERIRIYGIDCPERGQPYGTKARHFTSRLVFGRMVTVVPKDTDKYGRTVARISLPDGSDLVEELVKAGLAWWYKRYSPHDSELEKLEREAREAKRGLWKEPKPVPPWEWRHAAHSRT